MTEKRNVRVGRLDTIGRVSTELGKLYRQARRGEVDTSDASRLAGILKCMRECLEASALEQRLTELEQTIAAAVATPVSQLDHEPLPNGGWQPDPEILKRVGHGQRN